MSYASETKTLIRWAKIHAALCGRSALHIVDFLGALRHAIEYGDPSLRQAILDAIGVSAEHTWQWPQGVRDISGAALPPGALDAKFPLQGTLHEVVHKVWGEDERLPVDRLVQAIVEAHDEAARAFRELNRSSVAPTRRRWIASTLDEAARLREFLSGRVLGQEQAVQMFVEAFARARWAPREDRPRGIFVFMGPPGVGKTLLARELAAGLKHATGRDHAEVFLDMSTRSGPQAHEELLGAASFYAGSRTGSLTGPVDKLGNKPAVIVLDEIEKAHPNTLNALLPLFDRGELRDDNLGKVISFRNCWLVVTTNLGREVWSDPRFAFGLSPLERPGTLLKILATSRRGAAPAGLDELAEPALPAEFVSRLAQGAVVLFRPLSVDDYLALARRGMQRGRPGPMNADPLSVEADDETVFTMLLGLAPSCDARQVVTHFEKVPARILLQTVESLGVDAKPLARLRLRLSDEARADLRRALAPHAVSILVVDDQEHIAQAIETALGSLAKSVVRADSAESATATLSQHEIDLVLIDLNIHESPESARTAQALEILQAIRRTAPDVAVWGFSENPGNREHFDAVAEEVIRRGGVHGYIPCNTRPDVQGAAGEPGSFEEDAFAARVRELAAGLQRAGLFRERVRARRRAELSWDYRRNDADGTIEAVIEGWRDEPALEVADLASDIPVTPPGEKRFADVVGLHAVKDRLRQFVRWVKNPHELARFGERPPRGLLLYGPPGTGKTLVARAFCTEAGLPFIPFTPSQVLSKWFGDSERRLREVFERARSLAPSVVFIDEVDAFGKRDGDTPHSQAYVSILNELLTQMDGFSSWQRPVFVLGATNRLDAVDPALRRPGRFDEVIAVELPTLEDRTEFFRRALARRPVDAAVDPVKLAKQTVGWSPAEMERMVREAMYAAAVEGASAAGEAHFDRARRRVRFGEASAHRLGPREREQTAVHEAGHALLHVVEFPACPLDVVTIVPTTTGAAGFTAFEPSEDGTIWSRQEVRSFLAMSLAGLEAERAVYGPDGASAGAQDDLERATQLAWMAVARWGMDDELGPIAVESLPGAAESTLATQATQRSRQWLEDARERARKVLTDFARAHRALAQALLERELMSGDEVAEVLAAHGVSIQERSESL